MFFSKYNQTFSLNTAWSDNLFFAFCRSISFFIKILPKNFYEGVALIKVKCHMSTFRALFEETLMLIKIFTQLNFCIKWRQNSVKHR